MHPPVSSLQIYCEYTQRNQQVNNKTNKENTQQEPYHNKWKFKVIPQTVKQSQPNVDQANLEPLVEIIIETINDTDAEPSIPNKTESINIVTVPPAFQEDGSNTDNQEGQDQGKINFSSKTKIKMKVKYDFKTKVTLIYLQVKWKSN